MVVTCQLILKTTGEMLMQYRSMGSSNACTVGLQNATATQGSLLAHNQNYLQSNFAIRLRPTSWLDLSSSAGLVPKSSREAVDVRLNTAGLSYGSYQGTLLVQTGYVGQPLVALPIALEVTPIGTWRQTYFGLADNSGNGADTADPDGDSLWNIFEYAFNTDPTVGNASPISYAIVGNHLTITFQRKRPAPPDISYLFEVGDALEGVWQSGPSFTSQSVTDNLNGTETVTVTDSLEIGSAPAHYLRVRISRP
jgi:hypothetical protein